MKLSISLLLAPIILNYGILTAQAETFHAYLFADTDDEKIGTILENDSKIMYDTFNRITKVMKFDNDIVRYNGKDFSKDKLNEVLENKLKQVKKGDIVLFYVSSRGKNESGLFPSITFKNGMIKVEDIHNKLKRTSANLKLTISDCNNNSEENEKFLSRDTTQQKDLEDNIKKLFLENTGDIIFTSSEKSKKSFVDFEAQNSLFTINFIRQLKVVISTTHNKQNVNWKYLLEKTKQEVNMSATESKLEEQNPYGIINLKTKNYRYDK